MLANNVLKHPPSWQITKSPHTQTWATRHEMCLCFLDWHFIFTTQCNTGLPLFYLEQRERHTELAFSQYCSTYCTVPPPVQHFGRSNHILVHVASLRVSIILQQQSERVVLNYWGHIIIYRACKSTWNLLCGVPSGQWGAPKSITVWTPQLW